jgi:hypothetical protein
MGYRVEHVTGLGYKIYGYMVWGIGYSTLRVKGIRYRV